MKRIKVFRIAALLLAAALLTAPITLTRAKYISEATAYHDGDNGFYSYYGKVENTTPGGPYKAVLRKGWWAICLRGGQGGKHSQANYNQNDTGNGGSSGVAKAMYYFPEDTTVYYYVAEGGGFGGGNQGSFPFTSGNNPRKFSIYGGGQRGSGKNDSNASARQPSNGGGASLLWFGSASAPTSANQAGVTIVAVAGGGGGGGFDWDKQGNDVLPREETGGAAGNAVATVGEANPAKVTQNLNAWGGVSGGIGVKDRALASVYADRLAANHSTAQNWPENGKGGSLTAGGAKGENHLNTNGNGGFLQGGNGLTGQNGTDNGSGGGGGGYYGGGAGGQRQDRSDNHGGGGGSSYLNPNCYQLPTVGAYRYANDYFASKEYDLKSYENTNNASLPGVSAAGNAKTNEVKPPRHDGVVCLVYLGVETTLRYNAVVY